MYAAMMYANAPVTGPTAFNPVATAAAFLRNMKTDMKPVFTPLEFGLRVLAQCVAAVSAGAVATCILVGNHKVGHPAVGGGDIPHKFARALLAESVGTSLVVIAFLAVATGRADPRSRDNGVHGAVVGLAYLAATASVGAISGAALNPAVGLLTLVSDSDLSDEWLYWLGPAFGALVGLACFRLAAHDVLEAEAAGDDKKDYAALA